MNEIFCLFFVLSTQNLICILYVLQHISIQTLNFHRKYLMCISILQNLQMKKWIDLLAHVVHNVLKVFQHLDSVSVFKLRD